MLGTLLRRGGPAIQGGARPRGSSAAHTMPAPIPFSPSYTPHPQAVVRRRRCAVITAFQTSPHSVVPRPAGGAQPGTVPSLSCEVLEGNMVRFSEGGGTNVPTAVLVHGILGSRRNLAGFARMIVEGFPSWRVVLVDLRCHGGSAAAAGAPAADGPHTVDAAARDVLELLRSRRMFPHMLIGHSFGGKVVMSMARQFGAGARALPRPVQVWVLDAPPGPARAGGGGGAPGGAAAGGDHPARLIAALQRVRMPVAGRAELIDALTAEGFSLEVARWMTTNLRPSECGGLAWSFDLGGIAEMYSSYEESDLWGLLRSPPLGLKVDFVKATRGAFSWDGEAAIGGLGHRVHALDAGHWVHTDNPGGLFNILAPSLGAVDQHSEQARWQHTARR
ncbi:MAG: Alpha/Beta hydrolase protein [Monoraphidium minutum]|nr:MAG: Alpha/Beta hydrolase protein [Monoraphidium minutum]